MIQITPKISIDENELSEDFVRASGPGGQNVNKVSSAVQLRFDVAASTTLPPELKARLLKIAGKRATVGGVILIKAQEHRTRERNRTEAVARLSALIGQAAQVPIVRRPTRPTRSSGVRRLEAKSQRSEIKRARRAPGEE